MFTQGFNAIQQSMLNRSQQKFAVAMYNRQRNDALQDWSRQNEYNSPSAQMERLKAANLNPNLVYGNGATYNASPIRSTNADSWNPRAPTIFNRGVNPGDAMSFYDLKLREAQVDNLKTANTVMLQDAMLRKATTMFDLGLKSDLRDTSIDFKKGQVEKLHADTQLSLDENERRQIMNTRNVYESVERILNYRMQRSVNVAQRDHIRQQIENLKSDNSIKQFDIDLLKKGVRPGDNIILRKAAEALDKLDKMSPGDLIPDYKGKSLFTLDLDNLFN